MRINFNSKVGATGVKSIYQIWRRPILHHKLEFVEKTPGVNRLWHTRGKMEQRFIRTHTQETTDSRWCLILMSIPRLKTYVLPFKCKNQLWFLLSQHLWPIEANASGLSVKHSQTTLQAIDPTWKSFVQLAKKKHSTNCASQKQRQSSSSFDKFV